MTHTIALLLIAWAASGFFASSRIEGGRLSIRGRFGWRLVAAAPGVWIVALACYLIGSPEN